MPFYRTKMWIRNQDLHLSKNVCTGVNKEMHHEYHFRVLNIQNNPKWCDSVSVKYEVLWPILLYQIHCIKITVNGNTKMNFSIVIVRSKL